MHAIRRAQILRWKFSNFWLCLRPKIGLYHQGSGNIQQILQNRHFSRNIYIDTADSGIPDIQLKNGMTSNFVDTASRDVTVIDKILKVQLKDHDPEVALDQMKIVMSEDFLLTVLQRYRYDWKLALLFFNWASKQHGYSHRPTAYNEMVDILGRMKQIELMLEMFNNIPKQKVNERTFAILLNRLAGAHNISKAIDVFYKRKDYGFDLDTMSFQMLLTCLCRYKHVEEAEILFLEKQAEFPPVIKSWNIILNGWCVRGNLREAKRFWKDIISSGCKPDIFTYGALITSLTKAGKLGTAQKVFNKMWDKGCYPDVVICNCMIDAFSFKKKIPEALRIFGEMGKRGCEPNLATYNSLIKHICKIRRMEKAYELLDEMQEKGHLPNTKTYSYFLKTTKNPDEVASLLKMMKRSCCEIDIDTYNLILNLYIGWNYQSGIQELWRDMETNALGPDQRSYTVLIHGLYRKGQTDLAMQYFLEMQSKGMIPEPRTMLLVRQIESDKADVKIMI